MEPSDPIKKDKDHGSAFGLEDGETVFKHGCSKKRKEMACYCSWNFIYGTFAWPL